MAIDDLYGKILSQSILVIREQTSLPALVNHETMGDRAQGAQRGGVTEVIVPPEFSTRSITPAAVPPTSASAPSPTTVQITLDYWKEVNFPLTEKHVSLMENSDSNAQMFLANAVGPIVEDITASIMATYKGIYGAVGTAGTTPFASDPGVAQAATTKLTRQKCPRAMRQMVLNPGAYGNAIALDQFRAVERSGSRETFLEGTISRAYGFNWHEDAGIDITHTKGAAGTVLIDQADVAVGDTDVHLDGLTTKASVGDIFTVAGDTQQYVVLTASDLSTTDGDITFRPAAKVAWADNAAVTFVATHSVNLAFHPYAFALDSRPASRLNLPGVTSNFMTWVDDMTGLALRLEIRDEYHQTGFYLSCLWGTALVDPRLAVRVMGASGE